MFESQLTTKVNFRIHRLELMRYRQRKTETLDEFVNCYRAKAKECDFANNELNERVFELVIASTESEAFQRELLDKDRGFPINGMLETSRKYEAIATGKQCLQTLESTSPAVIGAISKKKTRIL